MADIPGVIVHGRYDVVCPVQNAWDLHKTWPRAELVITPASGHSAFEDENVDALVAATERYT
jgi:proline iminopeptidase